MAAPARTPLRWSTLELKMGASYTHWCTGSKGISDYFQDNNGKGRISQPLTNFFHSQMTQNKEEFLRKFANRKQKFVMTKGVAMEKTDLKST